jgi:hypothetical protein
MALCMRVVWDAEMNINGQTDFVELSTDFGDVSIPNDKYHNRAYVRMLVALRGWTQSIEDQGTFLVELGLDSLRKDRLNGRD